jgi:hypothetical protein
MIGNKETYPKYMKIMWINKHLAVPIPLYENETQILNKQTITYERIFHMKIPCMIHDTNRKLETTGIQRV